MRSMRGQVMLNRRFLPWTPQLLQELIDALKHKPGALLPILHAIQDHCGYVPREAVPLIADSLQLTRAEVHGVISFYHHFHITPPRCHVRHMCHAEACQARGAREQEYDVKHTLSSVERRRGRGGCVRGWACRHRCNVDT